MELHDLRFALRSLRKAPGFTAVAILTLALGIGANAAIFSVVHGVVLRPLPYPEPDRLVQIWENNDTFGRLSVAWTNFLDWRDQNESFEAVAGFNSNRGTILGGDQPLQLGTSMISADFFDVIGVEPSVGRAFTPEELVEGGEPASVVSYSFWQDNLGGTDNLGERPLIVGGFSTRVVGVMPPGFDFPAGTAVWYPIELSSQTTSRTAHNWRAIGRLRDGVTAEQAQEDLSLIASRFPGEADDEYLAQRAEVVSLRAQIAGPVQDPLMLLLGASLVVVLVGCTNLASTLLARGNARAGELAVQRALGAERSRVVRRLFTESLLLAGGGAIAGLLLAYALIRSLPALIPFDLPRMAEVGLHPMVTLAAIAISVIAAVLFGLFPALRASDTDISLALRTSSRSTSAARSRGPWRLFVIGEVALALMLLAGSALLLRSFFTVLDVDPGFDGRGVVTAQVALPSSKYGEIPQRVAYFDELLPQLRALPGVASVGVTSSAPLVSSGSNGRISIDGGPQPNVNASYQVADEDYFDTLGIPLVKGRLFAEADGPDAQHVVVVSQALADLAWPGDDPIGKRITGGGMDRFWEQPDAWATVVGVVGDVRQRDLTREVYPTFYFSYRQRADRLRGGDIAVKSAGVDPLSLVGPIREIIQRMDGDVPIEFETMDAVVRRSVGDRRFIMGVLGAFAAVALLLAALGIYGVVGYTVALRTREMGIRVALGSAPSGVLSMVLRESMTTVAIGLVIGTAGALAMSRVIANFLYETSPTDPLTIVATAVTLLAVAALASFIPARRAATIDPLITMRSD